MSSALSVLSPSMRAYVDAVISAQIIPLQALEAWLEATLSSGQALYDLAEQLPQSGLVDDFVLVRDLAQHLQIPYMGDLELELYGTAHPALSRTTCVEYGVLCVSDGPRDPLPMVVTNPVDQEVLGYISSLVGAELQLHLASASDLLREIDNCYGLEDDLDQLTHAGEQVTPLTAEPTPRPQTPPAHVGPPPALALKVSAEQALNEQARIDAFLSLLGGD